MQALIVVLIVLAFIILVGIGFLLFATWRNRHNKQVIENTNPSSSGELSQLSENLQEKLPVLDSKVENITKILNSQSSVLPVMDTKIDTLQKTNATEASVELLQRNLTRLEELTNKLDKKTKTLEVKTDNNAQIEQQHLNQLTNHLGKITSVDEKIDNNLRVSMNQTRMIPALDSKVETIKQHTGSINFIKETLTSLNHLVDNLNKATATISSQQTEQKQENQQQLSEVQNKIGDLTRIFINDRTRGLSGEYALETILAEYLGVKGSDHAWSTQYPIKNINNGTEIGRVDAVVKTPYKDQKIAIDAKFPLLDYKNMFTEEGKIIPERKAEFKKNIKNKVKDLKKYINQDYQVLSVIMFIPSESIYYFLDDECQDVVKYALKEKIWLAGPTVLMAMLSIQEKVIREHYFARNTQKMRDIINSLMGAFNRFDERATKLKEIYDNYITKTDKAFKELKYTQNQIENKTNKLKILESNDSIDETFDSNIQNQADKLESKEPVDGAFNAVDDQSELLNISQA